MARWPAVWGLALAVFLLWLSVALGTTLAGGGAVAVFGLRPLAVLLPPGAAVPTDHRVLLLSDEPESVRAAGVLYTDTVAGPFRVFLYALDGSGRPLHFHVLAMTDRASKGVRVRITRAGMGGPAVAGADAGVEAADAYAVPGRRRTVFLVPGAQAELVPGLSAVPDAPGATVEVVVDASASGPVRVVTAASYGPWPHLTRLPLLAPGGPPGTLMRGTFPHADETITVPVFNWVHQVSVPAIGRDAEGWSAVDAMAVRDRGNYGVSYRIRIVRYPLSLTTLPRLVASAILRWLTPPSVLLAPWPLQVWLAGGGLGPRPLRAWRDAWHWPLRGLRTETTRMHWMAVGGTNLPRVTVLPVG